MALLEVQDLQIRYEPEAARAGRRGPRRHASPIEPGEFVGLIGESGSGKTTLGMALLRLLEKPGRIAGGTIIFDGTDITTMSQDELRQFRWTDIATVFQSSMNSLNPVVRVEGQFRDVIEYHTDDARRRGAGPDQDAVRHGLHRPQVHHRLPARAVRRDEAAGQPGAGPGDRAAVRAAGRADHRPGRRRPARHLGERPQAADRARASPCCSSATTSAPCSTSPTGSW